MVPSRPNCVVDTEEHNHVLAVKKLAGKEALNSKYTISLRCIKVHDLHGPQGEYVFLVEEDPSLFRMLHPLHRVQEGDRPLVGDGGGVHGAGAGANGETRLRTEVGLVGTWVIIIIIAHTWQLLRTDLWASHRDC